MEYPTIHLNGTPRETLVDGYTDAMESLRLALVDLEQCSPNGRDYYIDGNLKGAADEHTKRIVKLNEVRQELYDIVMHIDA